MDNQTNNPTDTTSWMSYYVSLAIAAVGGLVVLIFLAKLAIFNLTQPFDKVQWSGLNLFVIALLSIPVVIAGDFNIKTGKKLGQQVLTSAQTKRIRSHHLLLKGFAALGIGLVAGTYVVYMVRAYIL